VGGRGERGSVIYRVCSAILLKSRAERERDQLTKEDLKGIYELDLFNRNGEGFREEGRGGKYIRVLWVSP
jgi:hypothetical protein